MKLAVTLLILTCFFGLQLMAQKGTVRGTIKDPVTGETLIGASVLYAPGKGTVADIDGNYVLELDYGDYTLTFSFVGFKPITKKITVDKKNITVNCNLKGLVLTEFEVVSDQARDRETPVAFATILPAKLEEELASQDIPMILNSTPGVYATQGGGGDGDARISIRGFNQRNVAVMLDGIPVNDMENGWVYWSNWFGLDAVTRSIQVQRGLGASKIAIPSVGGTMNILTKGMEQKKGGSIKQEVGSFGFYRTTIGLNSGKLKNGWGWTLAGSFKRGDGYVEQTYSKGWFYYAKVQKQLGKHIFSLSAMGAPQEHGQRAYKQPIWRYSDEKAAELYGANTKYSYDRSNMGLNYNEHWGEYRQYDLANNGDTAWGETKIVREKLNYFHKPMFSLRDFWTVNDKLYISTILYASLGRGGGTGNSETVGYITDKSDPNYGQFNYQAKYDANSHGLFNFYSDHERFSSAIIRSSVNNHDWFGFLSTFNYEISSSTKLAGGFDGRYYEGEHYREVYDLLGGNVFYDFANNGSPTGIKRVGDKIDYHYRGLVSWGGAFAQIEHKTGLISTFLNISGAFTGYKRIDYFKRKDLVLGDLTIKDTLQYLIGGASSVAYGPDSTAYYMNSPETTDAQTAWIYIPGYTIKGGFNYNINEWQNAFVNLGYISKAQRFQFVIDRSNQIYNNIDNEYIQALELGYGFRYKKWAANVNAYYTVWANKPFNGSIQVPNPDEIEIITKVIGMNALHMGLELDGVYKFSKVFEVEGLMSIGEWQWNSKAVVEVSDIYGNLLFNQEFDAKGLKVGDAAQTQFGASFKYKPFKSAYFKARGTYFGRNFSNFSPFEVDYADDVARSGPIQSWQMPNYYTVDIHLGYYFKIKQTKFNFRVSVLNALDERYIADASNNDRYIPKINASFRNVAESASVFFGLGRRINTSLKMSF